MTAVVVQGSGVNIYPKNNNMAADGTLPAGFGAWRQIICTGVPDGDAEPFASASKASTAHQVDATDSEANLWIKIADAKEDADWSLMALPG